MEWLNELEGRPVKVGRVMAKIPLDSIIEEDFSGYVTF